MTDGGGHSLYQSLCKQIVENHAAALPDLGALQILLPSQAAGQSFRLALIDALPATSRAIIPPSCSTLRRWVQQITPVDPGTTLLNQQQRLLLFSDALQQHPDLFREENKWQVAQALLQLFDELWLHQSSLPEDAGDWQQALQAAYQASTVNRHLTQEATLVHTLWLAWQQQLADSQQADPVQHYVQQLQQAIDHLDHRHCYIADYDMLPAERTFISRLVESGNATLVDVTPGGENGNRRFIDNCFDTDRELQHRSIESASLPQPDIALYRAVSTESEIAAIRLQLVQWCAEGKNGIGVICEDRKLSRRLRAVLEQHDIALQDDAGWFLSTTSAASVLERWLECIETDFDQRPLLDLLKSKFILPDDADANLEAVFRFERDIIRHENIASNLQRYRKQLHKREQRLADIFNWPQASYRQLESLLQCLHEASIQLVSLHAGGRQTAKTYLQACLDSLHQLQISDAMQQDAAGRHVISLIETLIASADICEAQFDWRDFRYFLSSHLERELFRPQTDDTHVRLMTLEQARLQCFDALVIAAAEKNSYPGSMQNSPFFNQSVRASLSLTDSKQFRAQRLQAFKQLLYADIPCLITCRKENDGDPVTPSPWIAALSQFTRLAFDVSMETGAFDPYIELQSQSAIANSQHLEAQTRAATPLASQDIPERISTSGHQRLIDCPYRFFAGDALYLRTADEITTELQKSDYGERIHRALQVFHSRQDDMPPPFDEVITSINKERAIAHLDEISEQVFRFDMENNALHRSWLQRWRQHIPAYIDWQIAQDTDWQVTDTESLAEADITDGHVLYGRLDRIDRSRDGNTLAIIDYKTGKAPSLDDVRCGENVQLSSYAMLQQNTDSVSYLELDKDKGKVSDASSLTGEELDDVTQRTSTRLNDTLEQISKGNSLPAWGDEATCSWCDFSGICRRAYWINRD